MDYSDILERIASSAEGIANAPTYWWITIIAPITILISAGLGYWASQRSIKKQTKILEENLTKKKKLVFKLLQDEINLRWSEHIKKDTENCVSENNMGCLRHFSTMIFRKSDIFIFREISRSFQEYYFLGNTALVSEIIHGYLLYTDLIDFSLTVNSFLAEHDQREKALSSGALKPEDIKKTMDSEFSEIISDLSSSLPNRIKAIDDRLQSILLKITS